MKRLSVQVEYHSMEYTNFKGNITKGHYKVVGVII
ncbi:hypothetical protein [Candidatus Coxiella mudrowiae]